MTTPRTLIARARAPRVTAEMAELYRRGCELRDAGHGDAYADSAESKEFRRVAKQLDWNCLHRVGEVSVFSDLSGAKPAYMVARDAPSHPDLCGWYSGRELQAALQAAVDARKKVKA